MKRQTEARSAKISRETKETRISVSLNLDGTGTNSIDSGIGFLDHLLDAFHLRLSRGHLILQRLHIEAKLVVLAYVAGRDVVDLHWIAYTDDDRHHLMDFGKTLIDSIKGS